MAWLNHGETWSMCTITAARLGWAPTICRGAFFIAKRENERPLLKEKEK